MTEREASGTAAGVSLLRAAHQIIDGEPKILDDPVAVRLLRPGAADAIRANPGRFRVPLALGLRAHVLARSRYAEDALREAAGRGVWQYMLLGAGMDTFACRQPAWAAGMRIFEVDHPASQGAKLATLERAGIAIPPNAAMVAADLDAAPPAGPLRAAGFEPAEPAFIAMLGVMMYLREPAVDALFRWAATLAPGTEMVFTFSPPPGEDASDVLAERAAEAGEPWLTRLGEDELRRRVLAAGLSRVDFVPAAELARRYFEGRDDGLQAPRNSRIAHAVV